MEQKRHSFDYDGLINIKDLNMTFIIKERGYSLDAYYEMLEKFLKITPDIIKHMNEYYIENNRANFLKKFSPLLALLTQMCGGVLTWKIRNMALVIGTYDNIIPYKDIDSLRNDLVRLLAQILKTYQGSDETITAMKDTIIMSDKKKTILAVDDMPDVLNTVKSMLQEDYLVFAVTSGGLAIKFLNSQYADLILLDIEMPGMDGYTLIKHIREIPKYEDTPIMFLTSNAQLNNVRQAVDVGAVDFLVKPVDKEIMLEKIKKYI